MIRFNMAVRAAVVGISIILGAALWFFFASKNIPMQLNYVVDSVVSKAVLDTLPPLPAIKEIRALYITAAIAKSDRMENIIRMIKDAPKDTAPNAVIIDIQDEEGRVIMDDRIRALVRRLRFLQIFPIARLVVFQNNSVAKDNPLWAIHRVDGGLWRDNGGRHWLDPSHKEVWNYVVGIARQAVESGFGEINFDYFRFPSEGVTTAIYPFWKDSSTGLGQEKIEVITNAARFLYDAVKKDNPEINITVDIFGYTFLRQRDLGIGQSAPALAMVFNFVYPMIYPSHYDPGNFNFTNPADYPYEVMFQTLEKGKEIFQAANQPFTNIRPWIQDFNLGAVYTVDMVQAQMKAINDAGLHKGWLIWNPNNRYRKEIFK